MDNSSLSDTSLSDKLKINDENETSIIDDVQNIHIEEYYIEEEEEEDDEYSDSEELEYVDEEEFFKDELLQQMNSTPKTEDPEKAQARRLLEESILAQWGYLRKEPPKHEPVTTPLAELNLVSAFKGSREKEGASAKEHRVSWAPDVYDPPPSLYDPPPKSKGIAGKNRQKGAGKKAGTSEGEGGKGKKNGRSKEGVKKEKTSGKGKDKKYGDKKQSKKRGGGSASKYSEFLEFDE